MNRLPTDNRCMDYALNVSRGRSSQIGIANDISLHMRYKGIGRLAKMWTNKLKIHSRTILKSCSLGWLVPNDQKDPILLMRYDNSLITEF